MSEATSKRALSGSESESKRPRLDTSENEETVEPSQQEQEIAVGITEYVTPHQSGFSCVVKQRYTDFLVNEILPSGEVVHLTDLPTSSKAPAEDGSGKANGERETASLTESTKAGQVTKSDPLEEQSNDGEQSRGATSSEQPPELSSEDKATLISIFGEDITGEIVNLYHSALKHPDRKPRDHAVINSGVIAEKSQRTQAHVAVRRIFNARLETSTLQDRPGVIAVSVAPTRGAAGARVAANGSRPKGSQPKGRLGWDELGGEYLHFTLYKENKDTMEVLYFMASQFKSNIRNFSFAGTKDRRGATAQRVALFRVHADRVIGLNKLAKGWVAGNFEYKKHGLELGELSGNEFHLTLRDCRLPNGHEAESQNRFEQIRTAVTAAAQSFRHQGFLNYYGLQRFGTFSTGTHITGMKMLQGDLEGAINSILSYDPAVLLEGAEDNKIPQENIARAQAIKTWRETGELGSNVPRRFQAEASIMDYLGRKDRKTKQRLQSRDWQGALMQIQRNLRLMYVHAYQSLVWNTVVGHRWKLYGNKVVAGDLVIIGEKDDGSKQAVDEVDEDGEPVFHPAADDSAVSAEDNYTRARPLSQEEADSGKYEIFDIVLPLPGYDVVYPPNEIGKFYEDFMGSEQGGQLDPHHMRRSWKDISLSGDYRKVLSKPGKDFDVEVKVCEESLKQLVETDLERVRKQQSTDESSTLQKQEHGTAESNGGSPTIALILKFQLGSSQYATMALRELTKGGAMLFRPDFSAPR